jgi:O-antigen ligase
MLPVSRQASVACLWLLALTVIVQAILKKPKISKQQIIISTLLFLFFAWHVFSLTFDPMQEEVKRSIERKLSFVAIPLVLLLGNNSILDAKKWALRGLYAGLFFTGTHMLINAIINSLQGFDLSYWMYHDFVKPYSLGAIYYSWYLSIAMISLAWDKQDFIIQKLRYFLLLYFLLLMFLAASKLFIILTVPIVFIKLLLKLPVKKRKVLGLSFILIIIIASMPFYNRIKELKNTDLDVVFLEKYEYDTPLNGLTLRLLQWRLADEILDENHAWLIGVGIGSRQNLLDFAYKNHYIYTGNPEIGDRGYLGYNFHNQFVETIVGTGAVGFVILLLIFIYVLICIRKTLFLSIPVYLVTVLFFVTESVIERQAGIMMFCLLMVTTQSKPLCIDINNGKNIKEI